MLRDKQIESLKLQVWLKSHLIGVEIMYDIVHEVMKNYTEATGSNLQVLVGSGTANTAETYVHPFKSGSQPIICYNLTDSGDPTYPVNYVLSNTYTTHTILASGTPAYNWIAIGQRSTQ